MEVFIKAKAYVDSYISIQKQGDDLLLFSYVHPRFPTVHRTVDGKFATSLALRVN